MVEKNTTQKEKLFNFPIKLAGGFGLAIMLIYSAWFLQWYRNQIPFIFYIENYRSLTYIGQTILLTGWCTVATIMLLTFLQSYKDSSIKMIGIALIILSISGCCLTIFSPQELPNIVDTVKINADTYFLVEISPHFLESHFFYDVYKCNNASFDCEKIYGTMNGNPYLKLMVSNNEVHVVKSFRDGDTWLVFTYGTPPRFYSDFIQLDENMYYLAYSRIPGENSSIYLLYKCELNTTDCVRLPFRYQINEYNTWLEADEATNEIKVFIDKEKYHETLIYIYGETPRCYVEGCELLDK